MARRSPFPHAARSGFTSVADGASRRRTRRRRARIRVRRACRLGGGKPCRPQPVAAGRFVVHGAHDRSRTAANRIGIEIEAALAFGTGHHGTTRGCLLALDDLAKRRKQIPIPPLKGEGRIGGLGCRLSTDAMEASERSEDPGGVSRKQYDPRPARLARHPPPYRGREKRVLDLGTGSGVLAIAAARAFRSRSSRPISIRRDCHRPRQRMLNRAGAMISFVAPAARGRASSRTGALRSDLCQYPAGPPDADGDGSVRLTAPIARIVLSGLLPGDANAVLSIYRAQGLRLERRIALEGWVTLVLIRTTPKRKLPRMRTRDRFGSQTRRLPTPERRLSLRDTRLPL